MGEQERRIDFCPENFRGKSAIPSGALIDLERLNTALAAIEGLFLREIGREGLSERITIAESLLLEDEDLD
jgi:uncharacterized protein